MKFPVLCFSHDGTVLARRDEEQLTICSKVALTNGYYNGLRLVDSAGLGYTVEMARPLQSDRGALAGITAAIVRTVRVELVLSAGPYPVSLAELNHQLKQALEEWEDEVAADAMLELLENSTSYEQTISAFF